MLSSCLVTQQTKVYQYTCHHCMEAQGKLVKSKERVDSIKNPARRKKAEEKEKEVRLCKDSVMVLARSLGLS